MLDFLNLLIKKERGTGMQEVIVSFYHCPVSLNVIEEDHGGIKYHRIQDINRHDINICSNFINNFNLYFKLGEDIEQEAAEEYTDQQSGKIYGFITEHSDNCPKAAGIITKEQYQKLIDKYENMNLNKILI